MDIPVDIEGWTSRRESRQSSTSSSSGPSDWTKASQQPASRACRARRGKVSTAGSPVIISSWSTAHACHEGAAVAEHEREGDEEVRGQGGDEDAEAGGEGIHGAVLVADERAAVAVVERERAEEAREREGDRGAEVGEDEGLPQWVIGKTSL